MAEESWRRNRLMHYGGGIMEEVTQESPGGTQVLEAPRRNQEAPEGTREACMRQPGGTQETPKRHPGGTQNTHGSRGFRERDMHSNHAQQKCKGCNYVSIPQGVFEGRFHVVPICTKNAPRQQWRILHIFRGTYIRP